MLHRMLSWPMFLLYLQDKCKTSTSMLHVSTQLTMCDEPCVSEVARDGTDAHELSHAFIGSSCVQVWDLFCGSLQMMFRPAPGAQITALATGTVHATQVRWLLLLSHAWDSCSGCVHVTCLQLCSTNSCHLWSCAVICMQSGFNHTCQLCYKQTHTQCCSACIECLLSLEMFRCHAAGSSCWHV